ncbi:MAG TPA: MaoC/PaaZ C-terminal domain-containing protein [Myxococcota bacterium]|nr:MaoC/PaaZ C-terminal domain-containing protein [Myxococcota bacterium]
MPYPSAIVGETTAPIDHDVDTRWLLAYAAVLDATEPILSDPRHPGGIVAHPLFPVCLEWDSMLALRRQIGRAELTRDEAARGVHAMHDLHLHRAIRPGARFTTIATIVSAEERRAGTFEIVRLDTRDAGGAAVATTYMSSIFRGVPLDGAPRAVAEVPAPPEPMTGSAERAARDLPANLGHTYTECARIWNPIHTDPKVAEAAGLPGIILHGTATLALAVGALWPALGGPDAVTRIGARFKGMVRTPARIEIAHQGDGKTRSGRVTLADGSEAIGALSVSAAR